MNSLFVPQLGSQIYTMPGMTTRLNLEADQLGEYRGSWRFASLRVALVAGIATCALPAWAIHFYWQESSTNGESHA